MKNENNVKSTTGLAIDEMKIVYLMLKNRTIHPKGKFDGKGRFYAENAGLIDVREPSRAWPMSHMNACRTLKYVKKVADSFKCSTVDDLIKVV